MQSQIVNTSAALAALLALASCGSKDTAAVTDVTDSLLAQSAGSYRAEDGSLAIRPDGSYRLRQTEEVMVHTDVAWSEPTPSKWDRERFERNYSMRCRADYQGDLRFLRNAQGTISVRFKIAAATLVDASIWNITESRDRNPTEVCKLYLAAVTRAGALEAPLAEQSVKVLSFALGYNGHEFDRKQGQYGATDTSYISWPRQDMKGLYVRNGEALDWTARALHGLDGTYLNIVSTARPAQQLVRISDASRLFVYTDNLCAIEVTAKIDRITVGGGSYRLVGRDLEPHRLATMDSRVYDRDRLTGENPDLCRATEVAMIEELGKTGIPFRSRPGSFQMTRIESEDPDLGPQFRVMHSFKRTADGSGITPAQ